MLSLESCQTREVSGKMSYPATASVNLRKSITIARYPESCAWWPPGSSVYVVPSRPLWQIVGEWLAGLGSGWRVLLLCCSLVLLQKVMVDGPGAVCRAGSFLESVVSDLNL